ncbi:hypothetical protein [Streptomyces sp. CC228A]|uniref:hypothetical protein n=1 Tax=Streptomyces sp. CC228A TaxID=2898186 RepID=UPI001F3F497E|nr:hypothetical protein [Streptomyces sp. CC228A]
MTHYQPGPVRRAAGGGAALAVLLSGLAAAAAMPAQAEPDPEPPAVLNIGSHGAGPLPRPAGALTEAHFTTYQYTVSGLRPDGRPVTGAELIVDTSGAEDVAEFRFPASCRVTEVEAVCPVTVPDEAHDPGAVLPFLVRPRLGTAAGDRGVVRATVRADNARAATERPAETEVRIEDRDAVADGGFPDPPQLDVAPGGTAGFSFDITNIGARPLDRVTVVADGFDGDRTVTLPGDHGNCWYRTADPAKPGSARIGMACEIDTVLEPGRTYTVAPELQVAMAGLAESGRIEVYATTTAVERTGVKGGSAPLALAPRTSPVPPRVPRPVDRDHVGAERPGGAQRGGRGRCGRRGERPDGGRGGVQRRGRRGEPGAGAAGPSWRPGRGPAGCGGRAARRAVRADDLAGRREGRQAVLRRPAGRRGAGAVRRGLPLHGRRGAGAGRQAAVRLHAEGGAGPRRGAGRGVRAAESPYDAEQRARVAFLTVSASAAGGAEPSPSGSPSASAAPTASASPSAAVPSAAARRPRAIRVRWPARVRTVPWCSAEPRRP